jgi:hypothetical protein
MLQGVAYLTQEANCLLVLPIDFPFQLGGMRVVDASGQTAFHGSSSTYTS